MMIFAGSYYDTLAFITSLIVGEGRTLIMKYADLYELSSKQENIALTMTMNTNPRPNPKNKQDALLLKNMIAEAKKRLLETYAKREVDGLLENLEQVPSKIDHTKNEYGLAIFISEHIIKIFDLPFAPGNRIKIADRFHTRTLLRKLEQTDHYYILAISQSEVRLLEAYNDKLVQEIKDGAFPFKNTVFYKYADNEAKSDAGAADKNAQEFFRSVNRQLQSIYDENPMPIILAGTVENIANYHEVVSDKKFVIGEVQGNFDNHDGTDIKELIEKTSHVIEEYKQFQYLHILDDIAQAQNKHLLESDVSSIYTFAKAGQIKTFITQEDYYYPGYIDDTGMLLHESKADGVYIDDAINDIVLTVLKNGGNVIFLPPFYLDEQQALAILRWRD